MATLHRAAALNCVLHLFEVREKIDVVVWQGWQPQTVVLLDVLYQRNVLGYFVPVETDSKRLTGGCRAPGSPEQEQAERYEILPPFLHAT